MQDNSIDYDIKIVCFNNIQWIGNGLIIPAGPLREKLDSIKKYDAIVINGDPRLNGDLVNEINKIKTDLQILKLSMKYLTWKNLIRKLTMLSFLELEIRKTF